jgi:glycosyltransferase involved in cell wall biosynthesis
MKKISILIPTYNSPHALDLCIRSCVEGCTNLNQIEILIGVDGLYEKNKKVLDKWKPHIKIINSEENIGLPGMTNLLVYNAVNDNILIINDDNVCPNSYNKILGASNTENNIITPNQIEPSSSMFKQFHIKDLGKDPQTFDLNKFWEYEKSITMNTSQLITNEGGTLPVFMKKIDFLRVGGWDMEYPENGIVADLDFFHKCRLSGINLLRDYSLYFYHFSSQTVNGEKRKTTEQQAFIYSKYKWGYYLKHNEDLF